MNHISITDIQGIRFGNAQNQQAMTGVTVVLFDRSNTGGIDISGGGPASRETGLLSPLSNPNSLNALVLSGGSAFGLDASTWRSITWATTSSTPPSLWSASPVSSTWG